MSKWDPLKNQPSFSADNMLLLADGSVMVHEFQSNKWHKLSPDGNGSYVNGSWTDLAPMLDNSAIPTSAAGPTYAPTFFASAVFADGRVFIAGGEYNGNQSTASDMLNAEIYDPVTDSWKIISTPSGWTGIGDAVTCVLPDGRLLLGNFNSTNTALYDPDTDIWVAGGGGGASTRLEQGGDASRLLLGDEVQRVELEGRLIRRQRLLELAQLALRLAEAVARLFVGAVAFNDSFVYGQRVGPAALERCCDRLFHIQAARLHVFRISQHSLPKAPQPGSL